MGLMSVCLVWLELALPLTTKKKAIKTIKNCVRMGGLILGLSSSIYGAWAKQMSVILIAALLSNIFLIFGFWKTPSMLFNSLNIRNPKRTHWNPFRKRRIANKVLPIEAKMEPSKGPAISVGRYNNQWSKSLTKVRKKMSRYRDSRKYNVHIPAEKIQLITDFARNLIGSLFLVCLSVSGFLATYYFPIKAGHVYFVCACSMSLTITKVHFQLIYFLKNVHTV